LAGETSQLQDELAIQKTEGKFDARADTSTANLRESHAILLKENTQLKNQSKFTTERF